MQLNIFTDASITKTINGETIGCSGAICKEDPSLEKLLITRDSTNNIAEITAVKLGVLLAIENRYNYNNINIWSDSQFSIFGLTKWIRSWINNMDNYMMKNSSGEYVKNQQIFLSIIKLIVDNDININFYHIKGHVDINSIKSISHATSVFSKANNVSISRDKIYDAAIMNNNVDNLTRRNLNEYKFSNIPVMHLHRGIVNPIISNEDIIRYYNLVTLGGNKI